jgi:hypothetical protein
MGIIHLYLGIFPDFFFGFRYDGDGMGWDGMGYEIRDMFRIECVSEGGWIW